MYTYSDAIALLLTDYSSAHEVAVEIIAGLAHDAYSVSTLPYQVTSC